MFVNQMVICFSSGLELWELKNGLVFRTVDPGIM